MPSGSHGGSRGSHRSGGARSSGGFSRSRSSGSFRPSTSRSPSSGHNNGPRSFGGGFGGWIMGLRRPFRIHFGTRVYVFGSKVALFIPFILFMAVLIIISSTRVSFCEDYIKNIKVDYAYYHQMILNAEQNPEYMKQGTVIDKFYNDDAGRWYYTYEIERENGFPLEGYTYSVYTNEQIASVIIDSPILIAINKTEVDLQTDSIPIDFKNFNYKDDGEYIEYSKDLKSAKLKKIVYWLIEIALIGGAVLYMVKTKKREDLEAQETKEREAEKHELEKKVLTQDLDWCCDYCGKINKAEKSKCEHCGAGKLI